jgi:dipeptidyl aminopeptidase/acylaminoacyl peptidase
MLGGAENQLVCDTRGSISSGGWGATWREDGTIVYSRGDSAGLLAVAAKGGDPHTLLRPDSSESDLHEPWSLPGDRGILFAAHRRNGGINALCLWTKQGRKLLLELPGQTLYTPSYSPTGHVLFRRTPTTPGIWALPFSLERLEATGEPFIVAPLGVNPTVARDGTLAYLQQGAGGMTEMYWADRSGKALGVIGAPEADASPTPALSLDGKSAIRSVLAGGNRDLWRYDTQRGTRTRLTFDPVAEDAAVFSPSGERIAYHAATGGSNAIDGLRVITRRADGTGDADTLASAAAAPVFTPDNQVIFVALPDNATRWDLTEIGVVPGSPSRVLVRGNPWANEGRVAPSGDLMAYMSNESGRWEVFLTRYPSCEGKWQVSSAGGQWPRWDATGRRLFYVENDRIMEVEVTHGAAPSLAAPTVLFTRPPTTAGGFSLVPSFDVTSDGQRFLLTRTTGTLGSVHGPTVVQNWFAEFAEAKSR